MLAPPLTLCLPFMENGDLLSYIKKRRESLLVTECDDSDKVHVHLITHFSTHIHVCHQLSLSA